MARGGSARPGSRGEKTPAFRRPSGPPKTKQYLEKLVTDYPESWSEIYRQAADDLDFAVTDVGEAAEIVREFIAVIEAVR